MCVRTQQRKYVRNSASRRVAAVLLFMPMVAVGAGAQHKGGWRVPEQANANSARPGPLDKQELALHALIRAGRIPGLRWPDISDFRADADKFYSRLHYDSAWLRNGRPTSQALQMIQILQRADTEGLSAADYDSSRWPGRLALLDRPHSPADEMNFDAALTVCAMRYVSALHVGRIDPRYFKFALDVRPKELDLPAFVQERLADGEDLPAQLAAIEPPFAGYRELKAALLTYMQLAKEDDGTTLPEPSDIGYPGPPYAGYPRLIRLLRLLGDLPGDYSVVEASARLYDPALLKAVRHFQERHGLMATGYLDSATIQELNVPLGDRVDQIRLALERYRWLRYDFPQPPIVVNIPQYRLFAFDHAGHVALTMRVDVGEDFDSTRTPVLEDNIEYLVFRPYWNVPLPIQRDEIVPILAETPSYLWRFHFEVVDSSGQVTSAKITPDLLRGLRSGRLRLLQRPGPDNALGLLKFVFPNRYNVYLHDVPSREFNFALLPRVASHGCVHVENPAELAAWMLRDQPQWTLERVQQTMRSGKDNFRVNLSKPLPVLMVYTTVSGRDGDLHFYRDIYGYDADLLGVLARGYPYPSETKTKVKLQR